MCVGIIRIRPDPRFFPRGGAGACSTSINQDGWSVSTKTSSFSGHFHAKSGISRLKVGQSSFSDVASV